MKRIFGLLAMSLCLLGGLRAGTTYNITSNTSWSASLPGYCSKCTINVAAGITLTLDNSSQCDQCTFSGGTIVITSGFAFQSSSISNTTINAGTSFNMYSSNSLTNVILNMTAGSLAPGPLTVSNSTFNFSGSSALTINGASDITGSNFTFSGTGGLVSNGAMDLSGSTLTFKNTTSFVSNGQMTLSSSFLNFGDNTQLTSNSNVSLNNSSRIIAGDGSTTSNAGLLFNGTLTLVDAASELLLANVNNTYTSWNKYKSLSNSKSYTTVVSSQPTVSGPVGFTSSGILPVNILAMLVSDFRISENQNHTIKLSWSLSGTEGGTRLQIERSNGDQSFSTLHTITANAVDGDYAYTDESPIAGINAYRLKLTDPEGKVSYSSIVSARADAEPVIRIFPNPCQGGDFNIRFPSVQSALIRIFSAEGKLLYMNSFSGQSQYAIHIPVSSSGWLVVQVLSGGEMKAFNLLNMAH